MGIYLTKKDLATAAGYTYRRLYDIDRELPEDKKLFVEGQGGKYDLALFVQRWVDYNLENQAGSDRSLDEVKAIHEAVKTRKTQLEVGKLEGRLVDVGEIRKLWGDVANTVMQNMLRLPSKVAPRLVMIKDADIIAGVIDGEVRTVLTRIADTPLPEEAAVTGDEGESEEG